MDPKRLLVLFLFPFPFPAQVVVSSIAMQLYANMVIPPNAIPVVIAVHESSLYITMHSRSGFVPLALLLPRRPLILNFFFLSFVVGLLFCAD